MRVMPIPASMLNSSEISAFVKCRRLFRGEDFEEMGCTNLVFSCSGEVTV
jgi:hypothetical protein